MKSFHERNVALKCSSKTAIDSSPSPGSGSESGPSDSKFSKSSVWSNFFASAFSIFDTYSESSCEKKASLSKNNEWTAAVKRAVSDGSMRRIHERVLRPSKIGISSSTRDIWLLGVRYKISQEKSSRDVDATNGVAAIKQDFLSRILMTYRKGFDAIGDIKITSDVGWGCMLRSSQMLVAQALLFHRLGRSWRRPLQKPFDQAYIVILHQFGDSEASSFSIHNLVQAGKIYGLAAGSWVGPYAMCRSWEFFTRCKREENDPEHPYKVKGLWLFRGQKIPQFVLDECYDMELYKWKKVDISDETQKERLGQMIEDCEPFLLFCILWTSRLHCKNAVHESCGPAWMMLILAFFYIIRLGPSRLVDLFL